MNIIVREVDRLRIQNWDQGVFADVDSTNGQYVLGVQFHDMHNLQLRQKEGSFQMFVLPKHWKASETDFGWWEDAEIIWESFKREES